MAEIPGISSHRACLLLAAPDTLHLSVDIEISDEVRAKLEREKLAAQEADKTNPVHCPEWLGAHVLPHGARGGYGLLLETDEFSVKVLGNGIPNRPGLFLELRSHFLHMHPKGPQGACEEARCWLLEQTVIERIREEIFTPQYIKTEVAQANALLAEQSGDSDRKIRQAEVAETVSRKALENSGKFIAARGANPVIQEQYEPR